MLRVICPSTFPGRGIYEVCVSQTPIFFGCRSSLFKHVSRFGRPICVSPARQRFWGPLFDPFVRHTVRDYRVVSQVTQVSQMGPGTLVRTPVPCARVMMTLASRGKLPQTTISISISICISITISISTSTSISTRTSISTSTSSSTSTTTSTSTDTSSSTNTSTSTNTNSNTDTNTNTNTDSSLREFASASERHHDSGARYRGSNQRPGTHLGHLGHLGHHSVITNCMPHKGVKKWTPKALACRRDANWPPKTRDMFKK